MGRVKKGEYIRTKNGYIGKLLNFIKDDVFYATIECDFIIGGMPITKDDIKNHSKNIIDLIEIGDYVNDQLIVMLKDEKTNKIYTDKWIGNKDIKSIVTKQQFANAKYWVRISL